MSSALFMRLGALFLFSTGALLFFFPAAIIEKFLIEKSDGICWHLIRCFGSVLIGKGFTWWKLCQSKQLSTHSACLLSQITAATLVIVASVNAKNFYAASLSTFALRCIIWIHAAIIPVCVVQLIRIRWTVGALLYQKQLIFNSLLQTDAFCALVIGATWFAFPDWILSRQIKSEVLPVHIWLGRCFGSELLSIHVISNQFLYFQGAEDRKTWSYGHALINLGIFSAQVYSQFAYASFWNSNHWVGAGLFSIWTAVVFFTTYAMRIGIFH